MTLDNFNNNCGKITAKPVLPSAPEYLWVFLHIHQELTVPWWGQNGNFVPTWGQNQHNSNMHHQPQMIIETIFFTTMIIRCYK